MQRALDEAVGTPLLPEVLSSVAVRTDDDSIVAEFGLNGTAEPMVLRIRPATIAAACEAAEAAQPGALGDVTLYPWIEERLCTRRPSPGLVEM
jgi:hypothetical protein